MLTSFAMLSLAVQAPAAPYPYISRPDRLLLTWGPGAMRCEGGPVTPTVRSQPASALVWSRLEPSSVTFRFRIDASGRPLSIAADGPTRPPFGDDLAPALAASRFAAGSDRRDCSVTFTSRVTATAETTVEDLVAYTMAPTTGPLPPEGWARIYPAAATCNDAPRPAPLVQAFPDWDKVAGTPGQRDWTMFAFDQDRRGAPRDVAVLTGTGNPELAAAGAAALRRSRYTGGARSGCRFPFHRAAAILPAPPAPESASLTGAEPPAICQGDWARAPVLVYPLAFQRRSIEGWAVIGYDVAPWGDTGNVRVLAAEPAAAFGEQGVNVIRSARRAASSAGATGCVERVMFRMGRPGEAGAPPTD
jgi:hypothetical protein